MAFTILSVSYRSFHEKVSTMDIATANLRLSSTARNAMLFEIYVTIEPIL